MNMSVGVFIVTHCQGEVGDGNSAPQNTVLPSHDYEAPLTPVIDTQITGVAGEWTGNPTITHQWQKALTDAGPWSDVSGATSINYTPLTADNVFGYVLRRLEIPNGDTDAAAASAATGAVVYASIDAMMIATLPGVFAVWPLTESSGTVADNAEGTAALDGTYVNAPALANTAFPAGGSVPLFNGTDEAVNIYSAAFASAFNKEKGWLLLWFKDPAPSGGAASLAFIYTDGDNSISFRRASAYQYQLTREANNIIFYTAQHSAWTGFHMVAMAWDTAAEDQRYWFDGLPVDEWSVAPNMGVWAGALAASFVALFATRGDTGSGSFGGAGGHAAIGAGEVLTDEQVALVFDTVITTADDIAFAGDSKTFHNAWCGRLAGEVGNEDATMCRVVSPVFAANGYTVAQMRANIEANVATAHGNPSKMCINIGVNNAASLPTEAAFKADLNAAIAAARGKWPAIEIYIARVWNRAQPTNCATINGWINDVIASQAYIHAGPDESVWLENGDDGVTYTTDGTHYSAAGQTENVAQWKTALGL